MEHIKAQIDWNSIISKNCAELRTTLGAAMQTVLESTEKEDHGTEKLLYISFLRTSVADQYPLYRITLTNRKGWGDLHPIWEYWDISCISQKIYVMHSLSEKSATKGLKDYEEVTHPLSNDRTLYLTYMHANFSSKDTTNLFTFLGNEYYHILEGIKGRDNHISKLTV